MGRTAGGRRVPPVLTPVLAPAVLAPTARAPRTTCLVRRTGSTTSASRGAPDWTAPTRPPSIDGKRADRTATVERPARHHNGMGTQYPAPHARHDARAGPRGQYRRTQEPETAAS